MDDDLLAVLEDVHSLGWGRVEAAVEGIEEVPVDHGGRADQAFGVDEVAGALLVHVHRRLGEGPGHVAHPSGMIEVDVGHGHPGQVSR